MEESRKIYTVNRRGFSIMMHLLRVNVMSPYFLVLAFCQVHNVAGSPIFPTVFNNTENLGSFERHNSTCEKIKARSMEFRLTGGYYAKPGEFPWMAAVHRLDDDDIAMICGGTIVSTRWILTAGHCIAGEPQKFLIVLGIVDKDGIDYDQYEGPGISMITTKGALHPHYSPLHNDIGLLRMTHDISFNDNIQPITLAGRNEVPVSFAGDMGVVVGWGRDGGSESGASRILKRLLIPIIGNGECQDSWKTVDDGHICTRSRTGSDACHGDSGGPLVVKIDEGYVQVGIVSYGEDECLSIRPGVFTRVSNYAGWIERVTGLVPGSEISF